MTDNNLAIYLSQWSYGTLIYTGVKRFENLTPYLLTRFFIVIRTPGNPQTRRQRRRDP